MDLDDRGALVGIADQHFGGCVDDHRQRVLVDVDHLAVGSEGLEGRDRRGARRSRDRAGQCVIACRPENGPGTGHEALVVAAVVEAKGRGDGRRVSSEGATVSGRHRGTALVEVDAEAEVVLALAAEVERPAGRADLAETNTRDRRRRRRNELEPGAARASAAPDIEVDQLLIIRVDRTQIVVDEVDPEQVHAAREGVEVDRGEVVLLDRRALVDDVLDVAVAGHVGGCVRRIEREVAELERQQVTGQHVARGAVVEDQLRGPRPDQERLREVGDLAIGVGDPEPVGSCRAVDRQRCLERAVGGEAEVGQGDHRRVGAERVEAAEVGGEDAGAGGADVVACDRDPGPVVGVSSRRSVTREPERGVDCERREVAREAAWVGHRDRVVAGDQGPRRDAH